MTKRAAKPTAIAAWKKLRAQLSQLPAYLAERVAREIREDLDRDWPAREKT